MNEGDQINQSELLHQLTKLLASDEESQRRIETSGTPIEQLLEEFTEGLRARGCMPEHCIVSADHVRRIAGAIGATRIGQLTPASVQEAVEKMTCIRKDSTIGIPLSNASKNGMFRSVHNFFAWLLLGGRIRENPFTGRMRSYRVKGNERRKRRIISEEELARLIEITEYGPSWQSKKQQCYALDGPTRADIYRLAVMTGLRANELRLITVGQAVLFGEECGIRLLASQAKNRQEAFQYITKELAERLRRYVVGRQAHERFFPRLPVETAAMVRFDLTRASISYKNEKGQFDFHALRKMCAALLAARNVPVKVIQKIMRHSTIELSMSLYADAQNKDLLAACNITPAFLPGAGNVTNPQTTPVVLAPAPTVRTDASELSSLPSELGLTTIPPVELFKPLGRGSSDEVWWVRYWTPERRKLEEPVSSDRQLTEAYARNLWLRLESRRLGMLPDVAPLYQRGPLPPEELGPSHRLHEQLPKFRQAMIEGGLAPDHADRHVHQCRRVFYALAAMGGSDADTSPAAVAAVVTAMRSQKTGLPLSPASRRHTEQSVRRFFRTIQREDRAVPDNGGGGRHPLHELLPEFEDGLVAGGLAIDLAQRHVERCNRIFSAWADAGGNSHSLLSLNEVIFSAGMRDARTGDPLGEATQRFHRQSVQRFFEMLAQRIKEMGDFSVEMMDRKRDARAVHRLEDLLPAFQNKLVAQGLGRVKAKRHATTCQRVLSALADNGGPDADPCAAAIEGVISGFRDPQTGRDILDETRQLYRQSMRRFFKLVSLARPASS